MKLPRLYTERVGLYCFYRGLRLSGEGPDHNMGAVGVVSLEQARKAYALKLRIAANQARKLRRQG